MKSLFHILRTIASSLVYFIFSGGGYGALFGSITGTAILPIIGTAAGTIIGLGMGVGSGFILALCIIPLHLLFFGPDTNLEVYRRWLAHGVGGSTVAVGLVGGVVLIKNISLLNHVFHPIEWIYILCGIGMVVMWVSLALAYTASYYPEDMTTGSFQTSDPFDPFMVNLYPDGAPASPVTGLIGAAIGLGIFLFRDPLIPRNIEQLAIIVGIGFFLGWFSPGVFAFYCALGNKFLLTFLKRVVFEDVWPDPSPHDYRITLTSISFVFTLLSLWWMLILAPLLALYVARKMYDHPITLPYEGYVKAKRKEKLSAELATD